jgi:hypothetical protein
MCFPLLSDRRRLVTMDPKSAEFFYSLAVGFAAFAGAAALFLALKEYSKSATVSADTAYIAGLGIIIYLFGRVVRYHFAGH